MPKLQIFLVFLILASVKIALTNENCFPNLSLFTEEFELLKIINTKIANKENFAPDCFNVLLKRGYYNAALEIYDNYVLVNQIDIGSEASSILYSTKREIDLIVNNLKTTNLTEVPEVQPPFHWVQSKSHVYIQIKFGYRIDSPACVNLKHEQVEITNKTLNMSIVCILNHQLLKYALNLTFFDEIDASNSTWALETGSMSFEIKKAEANNGTLWLRLLEEDKKVSIWFEKKKFHQRDMEDYFFMLEQESKKKEEESKKKKKKNKKKKNVITNESSDEEKLRAASES